MSNSIITSGPARLIDGALVLRLGINAQVFMSAVLLGGQSPPGAARGQPGDQPVRFLGGMVRVALDEIAALAASGPSQRAPLPERCLLPVR